MLSVEVNGPDRTPINPAAMAAAKDASIIITHFAPIGREMIESAEKLEIVATLRTGMENINLEAAAEKGVKVINSPCRASAAVADFTVAAMICEMRNIARTDADIKNGGWRKKFPNMPYSKNMRNYKVGLIGFGDIGKKMAVRLQGFDATVMAYDPYCSREEIAALGCVPASLDELIRESDFVSLHVRLTSETQDMFDGAMFDKMKPTAFFVNTARAGLVDEKALIRVLQEKRIGGAILDVFREEPLPKDHPLRSLDNVTLSAHLAGTSLGTFSASIEIVANNLVDYMQGKPLINVVN